MGSISSASFNNVMLESDYVPFGSTITSFYTIFQKCYDFISCQTVNPADHTYKRILDKSLLRTIILLIPVIGNIIIALYDMTQTNLLDKLDLSNPKIKYLVDLIKEGKTFWLATLGMKYRKGEEVEKNSELAFKLFELGASQGDPTCMYFCGIALVGGIGVAVDKERGRVLIFEAKKNGNIFAKDLITELNQPIGSQGSKSV
jgi:hypothetical protein